MTNTIYIGRQVEGVMANQIFSQRPQALIATLKEKYSLIENLFVACEDYLTAEKKMNTPGTLEYRAYKQL